MRFAGNASAGARRVKVEAEVGFWVAVLAAGRAWVRRSGAARRAWVVAESRREVLSAAVLSVRAARPLPGLLSAGSIAVGRFTSYERMPWSDSKP